MHLHRNAYPWTRLNCQTAKEEQTKKTTKKQTNQQPASKTVEYLLNGLSQLRIMKLILWLKEVKTVFFFFHCPRPLDLKETQATVGNVCQTPNRSLHCPEANRGMSLL